MTTSSPLAELSASIADLAAATTPSIVEVQSRHSLASDFVSITVTGATTPN